MGDESRWPEFEKALTTVYAEMPKEAASMRDRNIRPMNWLERNIFSMPGTLAITHPTGTIAYNKQRGIASGIPPEDIMAHELAHVRQINNRGGLFKQLLHRIMNGSDKSSYESYRRDPDEEEAFQQEKKFAGNRRRTTDVKLPYKGK